MENLQDRDILLRAMPIGIDAVPFAALKSVADCVFEESRVN
jgi:hypothetical protein